MPGFETIRTAREWKLILSGGETHYVEFKVRFGLLGAEPKLEIKTEQEAMDDSGLVREAMMNEEEMVMEEN